MKRRDLIRKIKTEANRRSVPWVLERSGARHDLYRLGDTLIPIPRHNEIGAGLTETILKQCESQLGHRWWRT